MNSKFLPLSFNHIEQMKLQDLSSKDFEAPPLKRARPIPQNTPHQSNSKNDNSAFQSLSSRGLAFARNAEDDNSLAGSSKKNEIKKLKSIRPISARIPNSEISTPAKSTLKSLPHFSPPSKSKSKKIPAPSPKKKALLTPLRPNDFRPSPPRTVKPLLPIISAGTTRLFESIRPPSIKSEKKLDTKSIIQMIPPAPEVRPIDLMEEGDMWSPKKKSKSYKLGGMASAASASLASAKTTHTLWIHQIARLLSSIKTQSNSSISTQDLAKLLQPVIRLRILELLPFGMNGLAGIQPIGWGEGKVLVTICGILTELDELEEDQAGVVVFSLHNHPTPTSNTIGVSIPSKRNGTTIFIPSHQNDLKLMVVGSEVWVWEEFFQVVLNPRKMVEVEEEMEEEVFWAAGKQEKVVEEAVDRALVVSKFGLLI